MSNIFQIKDNIADSISVLENLSKFSREIRIPTMQTFSMLTETTDEASHDWTSGTLVSPRELKCQVWDKAVLNMCVTSKGYSILKSALGGGGWGPVLFWGIPTTKIHFCLTPLPP